MTSTFFSENRSRLIDAVKGGVIVLAGHASLQRSNDAAFKFQQESNFWYLTGIDEADWRLVIEGSTKLSWLIAPNVSEVQRIFEGGISFSEAKSISGVDKVIDQDEAINLFRQLAKKHPIVHTVANPPYAEHFGFSLNPSISQNIQF